ncbi:MAG: dimethyl sulfoxide reductase anchor subunit, partial [Gammaproteobacteria bacterium]|nr:dimethyl sulfoxide reductase anchor subunit [Gammaproteobacteria bacterium]
PNIRFQQNKSLPREMTRPDSMPLRYERDEQGQGAYKAKVRKKNKDRQWGLSKLRSREDPLVVFTLITQTVVGAFMALFLGNEVLGFESLSIEHSPIAVPVFLFTLLALETFALVLSTMHLGKPHRFYRSFNNLRYSPVSREVAGIAVFFNMLGVYTLLTVLPSIFQEMPKDLITSLQSFFGWAAVVAGPVALYFMCKIYHIKARPFWNHWQVYTSFYGSMLSQGSLLTGLVFAGVLAGKGASYIELMQLLSVTVLAGLVLEAVGLVFHARDLEKRGGEGAASLHEQFTTFGKTYISRNIGLALSIVAVSVLVLSGVDGWGGYSGWFLTGVMLLATSLVGRALFYVLVIPTTMPGAFFWRNQSFQEHARETGLANMQQVGVVADIH